MASYKTPTLSSLTVQSSDNIESFKPDIARSENLLMRQRNKMLTSNILSSDEIAKEILARAEKKRPQQLPEGGDFIFQKQLCKRLAEKVIKEDTMNQSVSVEMLNSLPASKLQKLDSNHPNLDDRMLLQILNEGSESEYPKPMKPLKIPKFGRAAMDKEREKEIALKQLMEVLCKRRHRESNNNDSSSKSVSKPKKRLKNEVQTLLQDEGAVNMLYTKEEVDTEAATPPSKCCMKRALMKKAQEVSPTIMDRSVFTEERPLHHPTHQKNKKDKDFPESKRKNHSLDIDASPTVESSKIHKQFLASSYSDHNSPLRRISVDEAPKSVNEKDHKVLENGAAQSQLSNKNQDTNTNKTIDNKPKHTKLIKKTLRNSLKNKTPNFSKDTNKIDKTSKASVLKKTCKNDIAVKHVKFKLSDLVERNETSQEQTMGENYNKDIELPTENGFKEKLQTEFTNKLKNMMVRQGLFGKPKKTVLRRVKSSLNRHSRSRSVLTTKR